MSVVDLAFLAEGTTVPLDHGYMLLGALSDHVPGLHGGAAAIGVHPIFGQRDGSELWLVPGRSRVTLRLHRDQVREVAHALTGLRLSVGRAEVCLQGPAEVRPLRPAPDVRARFVTIKGFHASDEAFASAAQRHLDDTIGLRHGARLELQRRRVMRIHQHTVVGYGVIVRGLSERESLVLQAVGLGGRRSCGAGIFVPLNPAANDNAIARRKAALGVA